MKVTIVIEDQPDGSVTTTMTPSPQQIIERDLINPATTYALAAARAIVQLSHDAHKGKPNSRLILPPKFLDGL